MNYYQEGDERRIRVFVYYNLHKNQWSVKALEGPQKGKVIGHAVAVWLDDARAKVSEAGRQRVLREKRKNVHAGVVGTLLYMADRCIWHGPSLERYDRRVTYNPYKGPTFTYAGTDEPWERSAFAHMQEGKVYV